jgi:hypothetical protein
MQVKSREKVYSSICPGCGLACGLYIRESVSETGEASVSVDFRKSASVNAGKLCRFGLKLPIYYVEPQTSIVGGQKSGLETAISEAIKTLKTAPAESLAFFSVGNTTNEEQKAFSVLAGIFGATVETGVSVYSSLTARKYSALNQSMSLEEVEKAKQVFLFVDPYSRYPLLLRRVLRAKKNGAKVYIGPKDLPFADERFCLRTGEYGEILSLSPDSVLIADIHPYSDPDHIKEVLELSETSGAKTFFLKPFANSAGSELLAAYVKQRTLGRMFEDIDSGKVKTLFCLESDLLELAPDRETALRIFSKLDTLIVQTSTKGEFSRLADIVIASEPFYRKQGTVLNAEGRLLSTGGDSTVGFGALSSMATAFGKTLDFESIQKEIFEDFGIKESDEFVFESYDVPVSESDEDETSCFKCDPIPEASSSVLPEPCPEFSSASFSASFFYSPSPFMWHGLENGGTFVELNLQTVRRLRLVKGGTIKIRGQGKEVDVRFRMSNLEDGYLLSSQRLPIAGFSVTEVELSR